MVTDVSWDTLLSAAAVDASGNLLDKVASATNSTEGREVVLQDIVTAIRILRERRGSRGSRDRGASEVFRRGG
jgi:hypothetical protein